jgi:hypothetical protein
MLRQLLARGTGLAVLLSALGVASLTTSCGGGGAGFAAKDMVLVEFLFVDRSLQPAAPTGTKSLPRNAQLLLVFSEQVDPKSVHTQSLQLRYGPSAQSVPNGSFSVDGNTVRFDPTVTAQGQPNPFGFDAATQYLVDIPSINDQVDVIRNRDNDPNLVNFFTIFTTADGFLRELDPPTVEGITFVPAPDALTGQVPGNGIMRIEFNEPMDPSSFVLGGPLGVDPGVTTLDVRYRAGVLVNDNAGIGGDPVPGFLTHDASASVYTFNPTFSFGDQRYVFDVRVFQGLKDLAGNQLVNPRSFPGPEGYTVDGAGLSTGKILQESFATTVDADFAVTDADWGFSTQGLLQGQAITTRNAYLFSYSFVQVGNLWGQYAAFADPLIGAQLNNFVPNVSPPTSLGRRVMWAFRDDEIGASGTITGASWGPDSNATFAATYPTIFLRCGYQKSSSLNLSPSFSGNYEGSPTIVYTGSYQVTQAANVGDTPGHPTYTHASISPYPTFPPCAAGQLAPLFSATGFYAWPPFTTFFEWDDGDSALVGDKVLLFDASVAEGNTWQQIRGWFGSQYPCSGALALMIGGFPGRRMYSTYEDDMPNPPASFALGILNPEPSVSDTCFSITKRVSIAQSLWYTDDNQPTPSTQNTFLYPTLNDYLPAQVNPTVQPGGAQVVLQFQACDSVDADRRTINQAAPFLPDWTSNINDCDNFRNIRWRAMMISNLISGTRAGVADVTIPILAK